MDRVFPLGFPVATQTYLVLYVVTLVVHFLLVSYVVGGSAWLVVDLVLGRRDARAPRRRLVPAILSDWMPFALGSAITAGVAPLLFIQILDKHSFYTANLLLMHRWMMILPVLIVGFYLLYLCKTPRMHAWPRSVQLAVHLIPLGCFLFIGWSWAENHLLSLDGEAWPEFYASSQMIYTHATLLPRCAVWLMSSVPVMCMIVGWQLRHHAEREAEEVVRTTKLLSMVALVGIALAAACAWRYHAAIPSSAQALLQRPIASAYVWIGLVGIVLQIVGWLTVFSTRQMTRIMLGTITLGVIGVVLSVCVLRETLRLGTKNLTALTEIHERAAQVGGLGVFLIFFVLNIAAITVCVVLVRRGIQAKAAIVDRSEP